MKREHGAAYPSGTKSVAAPATVSGEYGPRKPLPLKRWEGKAIAMTRKSGDLPSVHAVCCPIGGKWRGTGCSEKDRKGKTFVNLSFKVSSLYQ